MDGLPEKLNKDDLVYFKQAPLNFVDIERSFAVYNVLVADNIQSLEFNDLKKPSPHLYIS